MSGPETGLTSLQSSRSCCQTFGNLAQTRASELALGKQHSLTAPSTEGFFTDTLSLEKQHGHTTGLHWIAWLLPCQGQLQPQPSFPQRLEMGR